MGISDLATEALLGLLKQGHENVVDAFKDRIYERGQDGMCEYQGIGKKYAPVAYALFSRLTSQGNQPRIPAHLAVNRYQSCKSEPNTVSFWADPDAITGLYESLQKDGHYATGSSTSP